MKLLVVDNDPEFRDLLQRHFGEYRIEVRGAEDAEEASRILADEGHDSFAVILLEAMLPGQSGWELLAQIRAAGSQTPTIFLTECGGTKECVRGLELGADDYVVKPFEVDELLARVGAVTRRRHYGPAIEAGGLCINVVRRQLDRDGQRIEMTPREFELLLALAEGAGRVLSRSELLRRVWNMNFDPGTNVVDVFVARLRRKLEGSGPPLIETVAGKGYRFSTPLS